MFELSVLFYCLILKPLLILNPHKEARHEFAARDKKHEIRLELIQTDAGEWAD